MALTKRLYKNHKVVITAENLNDIQDSILALEERAGIVPGEGESTKIINVINSAGTLTAASAAAYPDGLYWVAQPITFSGSTEGDTLEVVGLASKSGYTWLVYGSGGSGTTDSDGVIIEGSVQYPEMDLPEVQSVAVVEATDSAELTFSLEGGEDSVHTVTFENGRPVNINIDGTDVPITWG